MTRFVIRRVTYDVLSGAHSPYDIGYKGDIPYLCLDSAYVHALLSQGFGIKDDTELRTVEQILYGGKPVEATWALGAAVSML